jgi:hypothetical protein
VGGHSAAKRKSMICLCLIETVSIRSSCLAFSYLTLPCFALSLQNRANKIRKEKNDKDQKAADKWFTAKRFPFNTPTDLVDATSQWVYYMNQIWKINEGSNLSAADDNRLLAKCNTRVEDIWKTGKP